MKELFIYCLTSLMLLQSCGNNGQDNPVQALMSLSDLSNKASCVFLTKDEKNNPVISWTEMDSVGNKYFYFSNWDTVSQRFSSGMAIPIEHNMSIHEEGMPKIAIMGDGTFLATYETSVPSKKSKYGLSDIRYVMSFDKGRTWTNPKSVQADTPNRGSRSFSNIIRLDDGEIGIAWLDTDTESGHGGRPVRFAKTDGARGFGNSILIDAAACECCRTAISTDGNGNVNIVFRDLLPGMVRDMSISSSADNGKTFSGTVPFSDDHWEINGCPHNGPSISGRNKTTYVTWFTGSKKNGVFYAELDEKNNMLIKKRLDPNGRFAQLCVMPEGSRIVAYNVQYRQGESTYNKIKVARINDKNILEKEVTSPNANASYPVVQAVGKKSFIVAWTDNGHAYYTHRNMASVTDIAAEETTGSTR